MNDTRVKMSFERCAMSARGSEEFVERQIGNFMRLYNAEKEPCFFMSRNAAESLTENGLPEIPKNNPMIDHDVVAIYDEAGIPSFMHRFRKVMNQELFGGSDAVNGAFIIDGEEYDEIYISVYPNCEINGKPYSLPWAKPWTGLTLEEMEKVCFSKGEGWHLLTAPEWGLLANLSLKNGTLPHGNTNCGKFHGDPEEHGETWKDGPITVTGSGPKTWTHDHTATGVHDLCGNIWERVRGLRLKDGTLQGADFNNAASDRCDLTENGDGWVDIWTDDGDPVRISVEGDGIHVTTGNVMKDYTGNRWEDVIYEVESEELRELGFFPGDPKNYLYADSRDGEWLPIAGGAWNRGSNAGVFTWGLSHSRSRANSTVGFRSAFYRKGSGKIVFRD